MTHIYCYLDELKYYVTCTIKWTILVQQKVWNADHLNWPKVRVIRIKWNETNIRDKKKKKKKKKKETRTVKYKRVHISFTMPSNACTYLVSRSQNVYKKIVFKQDRGQLAVTEKLCLCYALSQHEIKQWE